jgi:hypothetical protein
MARKIRSPLNNRTARLALKRQGTPYGPAHVAPGVRLYYRRTKQAGTWVGEIADGKGSEQQLRVGTADDYENADGK